MSPRIGSLFSGYGGLEQGVQAVYGGSTAWVSDIDKGACKILTHRYPDIPNLGDITTVDWAQVEPVDILTGGSPCQDLSTAGKRSGMTEGTRSNLWVAMREAIAQLRPSLVIWENVRGAYSAEAKSSGSVVTKRSRGRTHRRVVYEGGLLENADGGPTLRALGRVLGDLSDLGYDASWHGLRAADIGAPHGRFRVFVVAFRGGVDAAADARLWRSAGRPANAVSALRPGHGDGPAAADSAQQLLPTPRATDGTKGGPNQRGSSGDLMLPSAVTHLLPTPTSSDTNGPGSHGDGGVDLRTAVSLLPTPRATRGGSNTETAQRLLPTPTVEDRKASGSAGYNGNEFCTLTDATVRQPDRWGIYADAIARWEALTRPAPAPTQSSKKGTPQLSAAFSEWLMGLPAGWVTDVPGITRNEALKALGNGVVPAQAAAAIRFLLAVGEVAA